jgi:IstB-like ATP binding protein
VFTSTITAFRSKLTTGIPLLKTGEVVSSQVPVNKWYEVIGEQTIADAILDRIIHDAHRLELKGDSMRKKRINFQSETEEKEN